MKTFSNSLKKLKKSIGGGYSCIVKSAALLILSALLFTSCENFLDNKDVKDEILDSIAYNNAPECPVLFSTQDNMGSFLVTGRQNLKVGYKIQVQYTVNTSDYIFECLEAVSTDESQSRADYVTFETIKADEQKGIYVINVTLTQQKNDILIKPKCKLIPKVKGITPAFESSGCDQDKPIIFEFNKPVNIESVKTKAKFDIYSDSESLNDCFNLANITFSTDGTTMSIKTTDKLLLPPDNEKNTLTVFVNYDFTEVLDSDNQKMNIKGAYEYRVSKAYGNQVTVKVYAQSDSGIHLALSEGDYKECTVGYSTDINYTFDSFSYYFAGFEAVKYADPQVNVDNLVSVESIMINQSAGAYKAHVQVLDGTDDILIKLKTDEFPAVSAHEPATSTEEINSHKPIIITFNTPVEAEDVLAENSIFNYKNILITCKDSSGKTIDASTYFNTPSFNKQKTKLTINPKPRALEAFITNTLNTTDIIINVNLKDTIIISKAGKDFTLKQDTNTNFNVCYNANLETVKPSKKEFFATTDIIKLSDNSIENCTQLNNVNINSMNAEQMFQNRVKDYIYIYGNYYDKDSGVSKVSIGIDDNDPDIIDLTSANAEFLTDDEGNTKFCVKYNLNLNNGAYCIKVKVLDVCDNPSDAETFYVISKKSYSRSELRFNIENGPFERLETSYNEDKMEAFQNHLQQTGLSGFVQEYNNSKNQIRIYETSYLYNYGDIDNYDPDDYTSEDSHILLYENAQAKAKYSIKDIKLYCTYVDKNNQTKQQEFSAFDEQKGYRSLELDLDTISGESITITAEDDFGAQGAFTVTFPARTDGYTENPGVPLYVLNVEQYKGFLIGAELDENHTETGLVDLEYYGGYAYYAPDYTDKIWYFYWSYDEYGNTLCSDFFDWNDTDSEELEVNYVITKDENNHVVVTFNFADDTWEKFDEIKFYPVNKNYNIKHDVAEYIIEKDTMSFTYARGDNYYSGEQFFYQRYSNSHGTYYGSFEFNGYKKGYLLGKKDITFNELGIIEKEYDDKPPKIEIIDAEEKDKITFIAQDFGESSNNRRVSGSIAQGGKIKLFNRKTNTYDEITLSQRDISIYGGGTTTQAYAKIDMQTAKNNYIVTEGKTVKLPYIYTVKDAAGNITQDCSAEVEIPICHAVCSQIDVANKKFLMQLKGTYTISRFTTTVWETVPLKDATASSYSTWLLATDDFDSAKITDNFIMFDVYITKAQRPDEKTPAWSIPRYKYSGSRTNTMKNDYIFRNGDKGVVVCSDAPVLVQEFTTEVPFDICKNWTEDQWRFFSSDGLHKLVDFEEGNTTPKVIYSTGCSSHNNVFIVVFANGNSIMTEAVEGKE